MVEKLAKFFGKKICDINGTTYYSFPTIDCLCSSNTEELLKNNSFGYRAKYISKSAKYIQREGGDKWLLNLKQMDYANAKTKLMELMGVGAKVVIRVYKCHVFRLPKIIFLGCRLYLFNVFGTFRSNTC